MSDSDLEAGEGIARRLWPTETDKFRDHLLRLDPESRRMRFAHAVSDAFIEQYASRMTAYGSLVYGHLVDGKVRGAAELRRLGDTWGEEAEAAFTVEKPYQGHGVGSDLMGRVVRAARNRNIRRLESGDVVGEILPERANYYSLAAESAADRMGFVIAALDLQTRLVRAA